MAFTEVIKVKIRRSAHFSCCLCHVLGVEIHHIVPVAEGGEDVEDNGAPLCPSCHEIYGANPQKRKFIREVRDFWYETCASRFAADPDRLDEMANVLSNTASKADLKGGIDRLEALIRDLQQEKDQKRYLADDVAQLRAVVQTLEFARRLAAVEHDRRKINLMLAVFRLPKKTQDKWHGLLKRSLKVESDAIWADELSNYAISGDLEERISHEFAMSERQFEEYLDDIVNRDLELVAAKPDVTMEGLTTADAERIQAEQAPPDLLKQWLGAQENERPFLMANWISEGKVQRVKFSAHRNCKGEAPGYFYMIRGRSLLVEGKKEEGLKYIRLAFVLDPDGAPQGFALWLGNPFGEDSRKLAADSDILAFVTEIYGPETAEVILQSRGGVSATKS